MTAALRPSVSACPACDGAPAAEAIAAAIREALASWQETPEFARPWLAGAVLYFANCNDDEPALSPARSRSSRRELGSAI